MTPSVLSSPIFDFIQFFMILLLGSLTQLQEAFNLKVSMPSNGRSSPSNEGQNIWQHFVESFNVKG